MSGIQSSSIIVGDERAKRIESTASVLIFGEGPRHAAGPPEQRGAAILEALAPSLRALRWCTQVHGTHLTRIGPGRPSGVECVCPGDGLLTTEPGVGLLVWTADCVPVLLASEGTVAAVHAGWRGAASGIVTHALELMRNETVEPTVIHAFLGPAVSGPKYQVGDDVIGALAVHGVDEARWRDGRHVDLRSFITGQLELLGVASVTTVGGCTASNPSLASYRRDGDRAGRQWSMIYRAAEK